LKTRSVPGGKRKKRKGKGKLFSTHRPIVRVYTANKKGDYSVTTEKKGREGTIPMSCPEEKKEIGTCAAE